MEGALKFAASKIIARVPEFISESCEPITPAMAIALALSAITSTELSKIRFSPSKVFIVSSFLARRTIISETKLASKRASARLIPALRNWSRPQYYLSDASRRRLIFFAATRRIFDFNIFNFYGDIARTKLIVFNFYRNFRQIFVIIYFIL